MSIDVISQPEKGKYCQQAYVEIKQNKKKPLQQILTIIKHYSL